jgi:hypothetical protein
MVSIGDPQPDQMAATSIACIHDIVESENFFDELQLSLDHAFICARPQQGPAPGASGRGSPGCYIESRRLDNAVPISLNVVTIWSAEVSRKNLLESLAQFCKSVEVGSLPVLTCTA